MSFVCFVFAAIVAFLAWLVGATWIDANSDLLRWDALMGLFGFLVALGLAVGTRPPPR